MNGSFGDHIPVMRPSVESPQKSLPRLQAVQESRIFSNNGPQVRELEQRFAGIFGVDQEKVVLAASGTAALSGAMEVSSVRTWDVPAWTFAATAHAAIAVGHTIKMVDVSPHTWAINMENKADRKVGKILVLPFGAPLRDVLWADDQEVVVDAAASLGNMLGRLGYLPARTALVFSLHSTKVMGIGEGGLVVFGDTNRAKEFRRWINFGFEGSRSSISRGVNAKFGEYAACFLHTELDHWEATKSRWMEARAKVVNFSRSHSLEISPNTDSGITPYWIIVLRSRLERDSLEKQMFAHNIETRRWWGGGLHTMPAFTGFQRETLETTDNLAQRYLGLPFFLGINEDHLERIDVVLESLQK